MRYHDNSCSIDPVPPHAVSTDIQWGVTRPAPWLRVVTFDEAEPSAPPPPMNPKAIGRLGRARLREIERRLGAKAVGHAVAIDVNSGAYTVGDSVAEAVATARSKWPGARLFVAKVGKAATYRLHSPTAR